MRKLFVLILPVIISSLCGCQKAANLGNAASGAGNQGPGSFTATIDGKTWVAMDSARSVSIMNGVIDISGLSSDNQNIVLSLAGATPGTYTLGPGSNSVASWTDSFCYFQDWSTIEGNIRQSGGQVVVSGIDAASQTISGTFQMSLYGDSARSIKVFTNGVFNRLPFFTSLPPAPATDTFTVMINGVPWTAPAITANLEAGEFMIRGSTEDGRKWVNIGLPRPAWLGTAWIGGTLPVGETGFVSQFSNNDSIFISERYVPAPQLGAAGDYYVYENSGGLQILVNDLAAHRLSASFQVQVTDSTGTDGVLLTNGYFSIHY